MLSLSIYLGCLGDTDETLEGLLRTPQPSCGWGFREKQPAPFTCQRHLHRGLLFKVSAFSFELCLPYHHAPPHTHINSPNHRLSDSDKALKMKRTAIRGFNTLSNVTSRMGMLTFIGFLIDARHLMHMHILY